MNQVYRKSLITGVIATLVVAPGWAVANQQETRGVPDPASGQTMDAQPTQAGSAIPSHGLYDKTPKELTRMDVLGTTGNELGTLEAVVAKRDGGEICAVIAVGGILGVGAKEIVVPLDELHLKGDELHILSTKEELINREVYASSEYRPVRPEDRPISEFSAFETMPLGGSD
jgi:sporulation protein YlmC with PRC-barrel domain